MMYYTIHNYIHTRLEVIDNGMNSTSNICFQGELLSLKFHIKTH